ncbi:uncharacterized protein At2g29880-like [Tasmannia lanceolata]|uniref:uncharacterized protein At2g29880-like n=1 Tax=Tasmannia lanceolata TaxID=3420 RepID=UPI0040641881
MAASRVGRNHYWNTEMDKVLVDALLEQVSEGHKIPNGFKDVAYTAASRAMNSRYGNDMTKEHIKNRVKTLKKKFVAVNTIINTSGFGWDDVNKKIEVTEDVYNAWVAVHPEHKKYFTEKHVLIDDFRHIFGEDYATGGWSRDDVAPSQEVQSSAPHIDDLGIGDTPETETIPESPMVGESSRGPGPRTSSPVRDFARSDEGQRGTKRSAAKYMNLMEGFTSTLEKVEDAIKDLLKEPFNNDELHDAVFGLEGFEEDILEMAYEYLNRNPTEVRAFKKYTVERRERYMWRKMENLES